MAEYEGDVVQNNDYKVRKLTGQLRAAGEQYLTLQAAYNALQAKYDEDTKELKAKIKKFIDRGVTLPRGRDIGFKPKPKASA
jgi:hypothetical protein